ncbi:MULTISPECIES: hypothetical protein [Hyphobacterium]|uniref:Uncharacterized protein n=1 Tax=Hyphobacterium vulgare TaxID=1736751 RepID=A0ABV6ZTT9_9PROT
MRSIMLAASLALAPVIPAFADSPEVPNDWPPLVRQALTAAHDGGEDDVWRFTLRADYGDAGEFTARFDSTLPEGEQWTLISPASASAMSAELRDQWNDLSTPDEDEAEAPAEGEDAEEETGQSFGIGGDGSGLFFSADTADLISGEVRELRRSGGRAVFAFAPNMSDGEDDAEADAFGEHLSGELTVSEGDAFVERIRIYAPASFKPHPIARVHAFEMVMDFAREDGLPGPIVRNFSTQIDISAMFQRQSQDISFTFSDVEYEAR